MKQRTAIFLAVALTAFAVVLVGAITFSIFSQMTTSQVQSPQPALVEKMDGGLGEQISVPAILPTNTPRATQTTIATAQPRIVSAERVSRIALTQIANAKLQSPPELVNYKGRMAYEVILSSGVVYVDAFTGKVLSRIVTVASNAAPTQENTSNGGNAASGNSNDGGNSSDNIPAVSSTDIPPPATDTPSQTTQQHDGDDDKNDDGGADDHSSDDGGQKKDGEHHDKKDKQDNKDNGGDDGHDEEDD